MHADYSNKWFDSEIRSWIGSPSSLSLTPRNISEYDALIIDAKVIGTAKKED